MRNRTYNIQIFNETTFTLYRSSQRLKHGKWLTWLPEKISPETNVTISFCSSHSIHSYALSLNYGIIFGKIKYLLQIKSSRTSNGCKITSEFNPYEQLEHNKNENPLRDFDYSDSSTSLCKVYNEVVESSKSSSDQAPVCKYVVRIQETREGARFISELRGRLKDKILRKEDLYGENGVIPKYSSHMDHGKTNDTSLDFSWDYRTSDWLDILRRSHRSILIRIVNLTGKHMKLALPSNDSTNNVLMGEGIWVEYPNEEIPSLCGTDFGCKCSGFFGEISGKCVYAVLGESGTFEFSWEQSSIGSLYVNAHHTLNSYIIVKHVESLNEAIAIFHIMDQSHPPLRILMARALSPNYVKHLDIKMMPKDRMGRTMFDSKPVKKNISKDSSNSDDMKNIVITDFVLKYYENSLDIDSKKNDCDFFIKSPRSFFDNVHSKNSNSPMNKITPDYFMYLEWKIGNERFYKVYNPNEKVQLDSSIVGGTSDKQVVMNSYLINVTFNEAEIFTKIKKIDNKSILNQNPLMNLPNTPLITSEFGGSSSPKVRPFLRNLNQSELLEYIIMIFNLFCDGLQPFIEKKMIKRFGLDWLKSCKIPSGHIWKNDDCIRIDIEGIIYIVTAYWMEIFDEVFGESTIVHTIQTAAIYWANQELHRFDSKYVWDILDASRTLLRKLKAEESVRNIDFITHKLIDS